MEKKVINPKTIAPPVYNAYSHGIKVGNLLFIAGQVPQDAQGRITAIRDIRKQTEQVFENIKAILAEAGATLDNVVKLNLYMVDMDNNYQGYTEVRSRYLQGGQKPASTLVEVKSLVPKEALIEIEAVAVLD